MKTNRLEEIQNAYTLRPDSMILVRLPNGDKLLLYSNKCGDYVSIRVDARDQKEDLRVTTSDDEHDTFTTQTVEIEGNFNGGKYTSVQFTAFHDKETEDETSKPKRITLSGNFDYDQYEEE